MEAHNERAWKEVRVQYKSKIAALNDKAPTFQQAIEIFTVCPNLRWAFWYPSTADMEIEMMITNLSSWARNIDFQPMRKPVNWDDMTPEHEIELHTHEHKNGTPFWKNDKVENLLEASKSDAVAYDALLLLCRRWLTRQAPFLPAIHGSLTEMADRGLIETKQLALPESVKAWLELHLRQPTRPRAKKRNQLRGRDLNIQLSLYGVEQLGFLAGRSRESHETSGIDALLVALWRLKASGSLPASTRIPTFTVLEKVWSRVGKDQKPYKKDKSEK